MDLKRHAVKKGHIIFIYNDPPYMFMVLDKPCAVNTNIIGSPLVHFSLCLRKRDLAYRHVSTKAYQGHHNCFGGVQSSMENSQAKWRVSEPCFARSIISRKMHPRQA